MANPATVDAKTAPKTATKRTDKEASAEIVRAWHTIQRHRVGKDALKLNASTRDAWFKNPDNFQTWCNYVEEIVIQASVAYRTLREIASANPGASVTIRDSKGSYSRTVGANQLVMALDRDESSILKCDLAQ